MIATYRTIDETIVEGFRPGYTDLLTCHFADKFSWGQSFACEVLCDALRFLSVCAVPLTGELAEAPIMVSSPIIDQVVDTLLLDVPLMIWLERNVFHARMVHTPAYAHGITDRAINNARYEFTISLMEAAGYELDREIIWPSRLPADYAPCSGGNDLDDCYMSAIRYSTLS